MKNITSLALIVLLVSCQNKSENKFEKIEKMNWLIGNWENNTKESVFREIWKKQSDSSYTAESFVLVAKDTVFFENVKLFQRNDSLFYTVSVKNQNGEKPVSFYATKIDKKEFIFENPKHDFPTKISYNLITSDSIIAQISGKKDGKELKEDFPMKKIKNK